MSGTPSHDHGRSIDWGGTSADYAACRPGYPPSFYDRLAALGVGLTEQRLLDLGAGTGAVSREFAWRGCVVSGVDVAENQIRAAREMAREEGLSVDFRVGPAEDTDFPDASFDVITAAQSWLYFDRERAIAEVKRLLAPGGRLMTCHICWLPREDAVARRSEELVLKHNPDWTAGDYSGDIPAFPKWARSHSCLAGMFYYDEPIRFTREQWRGRIRACRGVGATLAAEQVEGFDREHVALLAKTVPEEFTILHRIDAHIFAPEPTTE